MSKKYICLLLGALTVAFSSLRRPVGGPPRPAGVPLPRRPPHYKLPNKRNISVCLRSFALLARACGDADAVHAALITGSYIYTLYICTYIIYIFIYICTPILAYIYIYIIRFFSLLYNFSYLDGSSVGFPSLLCCCDVFCCCMRQEVLLHCSR